MKAAAATQEPAIDGRAEAIAKAVLGLVPVGKIAGRPTAFRYRCAFSKAHSDYLTRSTRGRWYRICGMDASAGSASIDPDTGFGWREITEPNTIAILEAAFLKMGLPEENDEVAAPARTAPVKRPVRQVETTSLAAKPSRDPRLPAVGKEIVRVWGKEQIRVRVLDEGFEFRGQRFGSLSKIARTITGKIHNGFAWFGLR